MERGLPARRAVLSQQDPEGKMPALQLADTY